MDLTILREEVTATKKSQWMPRIFKSPLNLLLAADSKEKLMKIYASLALPSEIRCQGHQLVVNQKFVGDNLQEDSKICKYANYESTSFSYKIIIRA